MFKLCLFFFPAEFAESVKEQRVVVVLALAVHLRLGVPLSFRAAETWQVSQLTDPQRKGRHQEMPQGVRDGAPRAMVHPVQVEEGLHPFRRLKWLPWLPNGGLEYYRLKSAKHYYH